MAQDSFSDAKANMIAANRRRIGERLDAVIRITEETAAQCKRQINDARTLDDTVATIMSTLRNSHNTTMAEMESCIRALGDMIAAHTIAND